MDNDTKCKVVGRVGIVQIKTHDGVVSTLSKVHHIPGMTRNLISLGTHEAKGYRCSAKNGVLKVIKGNMVLMKGFRQGSLYLLQASTVPAIVCTTSANVNTTRL